ncbi:hypothetical protein SARC_04499 [Sphaeroforma arctica JP610]|uniref:Uncharacterized protein n=1 Tax=Sphaeroforma arctica JP610 TaxID=667725 RepID=A0A0L0G4R9_9EUKA|nr:hypothetical protein SARC_04499 [Sphaeroforma arctica JP610]KNC83243.1 hypothetical protein SARC_04499 [Sphaeroforma arctica JP610]|eukprot:XP_014157145.1 hypothetical protein SARC_04499 [Sphaeroforma arctica JP610]
MDIPDQHPSKDVYSATSANLPNGAASIDPLSALANIASTMAPVVENGSNFNTVKPDTPLESVDASENSVGLESTESASKDHEHVNGVGEAEAQNHTELLGVNVPSANNVNDDEESLRISQTEPEMNVVAGVDTAEACPITSTGGAVSESGMAESSTKQVAVDESSTNNSGGGVVLDTENSEASAEVSEPVVQCHTAIENGESGSVVANEVSKDSKVSAESVNDKGDDTIYETSTPVKEAEGTVVDDVEAKESEAVAVPETAVKEQGAVAEAELAVQQKAEEQVSESIEAGAEAKIEAGQDTIVEASEEAERRAGEANGAKRKVKEAEGKAEEVKEPEGKAEEVEEPEGKPKRSKSLRESRRGRRA